MKPSALQGLFVILFGLAVAVRSRYTKTTGKQAKSPVTYGNENAFRRTDRESRLLKKVDDASERGRSNCTLTEENDFLYPERQTQRLRPKNGTADARVFKGHRRRRRESKDDFPQARKPFHVVATSAVIKNRLKKPAVVKMPKAIHIWGPTPFKTILEKLANMNANLRKQRGQVKRLMLPRFGLIGPLAAKRLFQVQHPSVSLLNGQPIQFGKKLIPNEIPEHFVTSPGGSPFRAFHTVSEPFEAPPPLRAFPAMHEIPEQLVSSPAVPPDTSYPVDLPDSPPDLPFPIYDGPYPSDFADTPANQMLVPPMAYGEEQFHHVIHHHHYHKGKGSTFLEIRNRFPINRSSKVITLQK